MKILLLNVAPRSGKEAADAGDIQLAHQKGPRDDMRISPLAFASVLLSLALPANELLAAPEKEREPAGTKLPLLVDRAVASFSVPEGGGRQRPYFVYERELAFEARLVALRDESHQVTKKEPYRRHHLQTALEAYIAKTLLAALPIDPAPSQEEIDKQLAAARLMVMEEAGGEAALMAAARAEGLGRLELRRYFRARAMASLYLHVMVTPMLDPSPLELRRVHRRGEGPLADRPFEEAEPALRRWYIARGMREAVVNYFQNARARVELEFL